MDRGNARAVYPIEAKWNGSPERQGDMLEIKGGPILRHAPFGIRGVLR